MATLSSLLLRQLSDPNYQTKNEELTFGEMDGNLKLLADCISQVGGELFAYNAATTYIGGRNYAVTTGTGTAKEVYLFVSASNQINVTPGTNAAVWKQISGTGTGGSGEANTASNVGSSGVGVFDGKVLTDLQFRNLNSLSTAITVALDAANQKIDFNLVLGNILTSALNNDAGFLTASTAFWGGLQRSGVDTQTIDQAISAAVTALVDSSPATLDTLNEIANALGDDPNFATTITNLIATKANLAHTHAIADITNLQGILDDMIEGKTQATANGGVLTIDGGAETKYFAKHYNMSAGASNIGTINVTGAKMVAFVITLTNLDSVDKTITFPSGTSINDFQFDVSTGGSNVVVIPAGQTVKIAGVRDPLAIWRTTATVPQSTGLTEDQNYATLISATNLNWPSTSYKAKAQLDIAGNTNLNISNMTDGMQRHLIVNQIGAATYTMTLTLPSGTSAFGNLTLATGSGAITEVHIVRAGNRILVFSNEMPAI